MKWLPKIIFVCLIVGLTMPAFGQANPSAEDDKFNLFLLSLVMIFTCAMIGAAIVGAMAATLFLFFLAALITLGVLSTSVAVGLYKRSFSSGFKTFLVIIFGISCAIIGAVGLLLVNHLASLHISTATSFIVGIIAGGLGGLLMALATIRMFQWMIRMVAWRFNAS